MKYLKIAILILLVVGTVWGVFNYFHSLRLEEQVAAVEKSIYALSISDADYNAVYSKYQLLGKKRLELERMWINITVTEGERVDINNNVALIQENWSFAASGANDLANIIHGHYKYGVLKTAKIQSLSEKRYDAPMELVLEDGTVLLVEPDQYFADVKSVTTKDGSSLASYNRWNWNYSRYPLLLTEGQGDGLREPF